MNNHVAAVLAALADPTRRHLFEALAEQPRAVGALAAGLPVTRGAVSQHLKTLRDAGLVTVSAAGTRRVYRIDPHGLAPLRDWLDELSAPSLAGLDASAATEKQDP